MKGLKILAMVFGLGVLTSCAHGTTDMEVLQLQERNMETILGLEMGVSEEQAILRMGTPEINEAYAQANGSKLVALFYYTNRVWADGLVTKDECTPLIFEDNQLVGWGNELYREKLKSALEKLPEDVSAPSDE